MKRLNRCKSMSLIDGSYTYYAIRGEAKKEIG
jgi:hypothetical protein